MDRSSRAASRSDTSVLNEQAISRFLDFDAYVSERTRLFSGRDWVFRRIDAWLAASAGARWFLLTGEQGSGKTAIAARLVQMARGDVPPPAGTAHLQRGFLSAVHFCSARDASWIDASTFARSLALQLTRYPGFGDALVNHTGASGPIIQGNARVGQAESGAVVAGVYIRNLTLSAVDPVAAFNQLVLLPLRTLYSGDFDQPLTIIVDGLDEALSRQGTASIVDLLSALELLPRPVRFILTSRREDAVESAFLGADGLFLSAPQFDADTSKDMSEFVVARLSTIPEVVGLNTAERFAAISTIISKADGNFRYVQFLLDALANRQHTLNDLEHVPPGLDALYHQALSRLLSLTNADWSADFAPVIGPLAVAREPLTLTRLRRFSGLPTGAVLENLRRLRQFVEELAPPSPDPDGANEPEDTNEYRYRLYHDSVAGFLDQPFLDAATRVPNRFYLVFSDWHHRIVDHYFGSAAARPWATWDAYALRYVAGHLAAAINREPADERHPDVQRLVKLVLDPSFQETHLDQLDDPVALERCLEEACFSAALDDDATALPFLVGSALERVVFRRERLRPESLFKLASEGHLEAAERRLTLYPIEPDWRRAVLLILAWLAAPNCPVEARRLCDQVDGEFDGPVPEGPLLELRACAWAALEGRPAEPVRPPLLPAQTLPEMVRETLARIGGFGRHSEMLQAYASSLMGYAPATSAAPAYLAQQDAPLLVRYAAQDVTEGTRQLLEYINVHAGYAYVEYRNQSLWYVLDAVVRHPHPDWVRGMAPIVAATALNVSGVQFQEGLLLTVLALRAAAGVPGATEQFELSVNDALDQAPPPDVPYERGEGDSWGTHRRRLASLAEAAAVLLGRDDTANRLVDLAQQLFVGFAGYQAPSSLRVAEAVRVCRPADAPAAVKALQVARTAAHNIQDALFCARTTARVNAMMQRWWGPASLATGSIQALARRLMRNPARPEFSAVHVIGEAYSERVEEPGKLPLPGWLREANSLDALARVYARPVLDFRRQNPEHATSSPQQVLPVGIALSVPDPGFTPLLAARLAAEALVHPSLAGPQRSTQRAAVIRPLVPVAAANPTALDTVLSRLLLAARPTDPQLLDELERLARRGMAEGPAGGQLQAILTAFIP